MNADTRPLIAHVLHRFDTGGLENGVANLINRLPDERYRHAVVALTEVTDFRRRIERDDVQFVALNKPPGQGFWLFPRVRALFQELAPAVVHTRNLGALEMAIPASWAGVPVRIHGEHGWDISDPEGKRLRNRLQRRAVRPFVHRYIALSQHLQRYLEEGVGVEPSRIAQIYNGVDTQRFHPREGARVGVEGLPFSGGGLWLVGTVGRLSPVKHQVLLARAFVRAVQLAPRAREHMRLVVAGDGPLASEIERVLHEGGCRDLAWLAGERNDVAALMRALDVFVLPSLAEGISNVILEAMATALPVIATKVGGNAELLRDGVTGRLVASDDVQAMADALLDEYDDPDQARRLGARARAEVQRRFSLDTMVAAYGALYEQCLWQASSRRPVAQRFSQEV